MSVSCSESTYSTSSQTQMPPEEDTQAHSNVSIKLKDDHANDPNQSTSKEKENWKAHLVKTLLAFGFYAGNLILNSLFITIQHERVPLDELPLPDISFDILPFWENGIFLVEYYMSLMVLMLILLFIFHRSGYRIAQRYCIINGVVYWLRAVTMSVTSLPVVGNRFDCAPKIEANATVYMFVQIIIKRSIFFIPSFGSQMLNKEFFCGDYIYSGHTINIVIGYSFLSIYLMPAEVKATSMLWWLADQIIFLLSIIAVIVLSIARGHYLVDIIFAYYVSTRTFYMYHTVCSHESLHYSTTGNFFPKFWWWPLFVFFEVDNPGRIAVVNRFYNPFSSIKNFFIVSKKGHNGVETSNSNLDDIDSNKKK